MSTLRLGPGAGAAAERFAAALDGGAAAADLRGPLAELVLVSERLAALPGPVLDPAAGARIRQRLVAVAAVQAADDATPARPGRAVSWRVRRLAGVAVGSLAGVTAVAGVAVGAAHSLPGDPFYGLKRAAERLQLDLAGSPADKGRKELEFASTRLAELRALGVHDPHAASLLRDMRAEVTAAESDLTTAARTSHSQAPIAEFETTTRRQVQGLLGLAKSAPTALLPQLEGTVTQITHLQQVTRGLPIPVPVVPGPGGSHPVRTGPPAERHIGSTGPSPGSHPTSHPATPERSTGPTSGPTSPQGLHPSTPPQRSTGPSPHQSLPTLPLKTTLPKPVSSLLQSLLPSGLRKLVK